ncbi:MAG: 3'-5' exonuclease, partial [Treponemataceae bacterium]
IEIALHEQDRIKYQTGRNLYAELQQLVTQKTTAQLITYLWYDKGYFYETLWNEEVASFSELYDYLFELARRHDEKNKPLSSFIDAVALMIEKSSRLSDMDIPIEQKQGVQLMSIHKSKGLEFHSVFLVSVQQGSRDRQHKSAAFFSDHTGLALNLPIHTLLSGQKKVSNYFYSLQKKEFDKKSCAELRRLLYVGMTRAEENLFVCGSVKIPAKCDLEKSLPLQEKLSFLWDAESEKRQKSEEKNGENFIPKSFLDLLFPLFPLEKPPYSFTEIKHSPIDETFEPEDFLPRQTALKNIFDSFSQLPPFPITLPQREKFSVTEIAKTTTVEQTFTNTITEYDELDILLTKLKKSFTAADFGTLVHLCIQEALINGGTLPNFDCFSLETSYHLEKIKHKITATTSQEKKDFILACAKKMSETFLHSDLCQEVLTADWRQTEFAFKYILKKDLPAAFTNRDHIIVNGTIDLLFEKNNEITIIDFKSDKKEDAQLYRDQLQIYKKASEIIYDKKVKTFLFYTRTGNIYELN